MLTVKSTAWVNLAKEPHAVHIGFAWVAERHILGRRKAPNRRLLFGSRMTQFQHAPIFLGLN